MPNVHIGDCNWCEGEDESGDEGVFLGDQLRRQPAAGGHGDGARGLQKGQTKYPEPHLLGWAKPRILLFTDVVVGCEMNGDVRFPSLGGSFNYEVSRHIQKLCNDLE